MTDIDLGDLQAAISELGNSAPDWLDQHEPRFASAVDAVLYYHPHLHGMAAAQQLSEAPVVPLTFAVATASWFLVERPILRVSARALGRRREPAGKPALAET